MEGTKRCYSCGEVKLVDEFNRCKAHKDGLKNQCRSCANDYYATWYTPDKGRVRGLSRYGLTIDSYSAILVSQNHCCKICGKHEDNETGPLRVDHDHITGRVRGLLCHKCNLGIGQLNDSPELVMKAYEYLLHNGESADAVLGILGDETTMLAQAGAHIPDQYKPLTETGADLGE